MLAPASQAKMVLLVQSRIKRLCTKSQFSLFAQQLAPEEHDVYSLVFPINTALQRSAMCFDVFSYMLLLTERNH